MNYNSLNSWFLNSWLFVKLVLKSKTIWASSYLVNKPLQVAGMSADLCKLTRPTQLNAIHCIAFNWDRLSNPIKPNRMDWVQFGLICAIEFHSLGNRTHIKFGVRFRSIAELNELNPRIEFDWVRLSSISEIMLMSMQAMKYVTKWFTEGSSVKIKQGKSRNIYELDLFLSQTNKDCRQTYFFLHSVSPLLPRKPHSYSRRRLFVPPRVWIQNGAR